MTATWLVAAGVVMALAGSEWGPGSDMDQSLKFDGKRVSGASGCNRYFGPYTQDGERLEIGSLGATRMLCAPGRNAKERAWFAMLGAVRQVEASHLVLILKDGNGRVLARLQRRDFD